MEHERRRPLLILIFGEESSLPAKGRCAVDSAWHIDRAPAAQASQGPKLGQTSKLFLADAFNQTYS